MKNKILFSILMAVLSLGVIATVKPVYAEEEIIEPEVTGSVVVSPGEHFTYSITENPQIGDVVTLEITTDFLYVIETVKVNGVAIVEDEETAGVYKFVLAEGENVVTVVTVLDKEVLGVLGELYEQSKAEDGTLSLEKIFSVENIILIVKWLLDGGILIAFARYFIKNKELEKKTEEAIQQTMDKLIPASTKEVVIASIQENIAPTFEKMGEYFSELQTATSTMAKCMALMQENTPEAKMAILEALNNLNIGDKDAINQTKEYLTNLIKQAEEKYVNTIAALEKIKEENQKVLESEEVVSSEDGTII